jgi:hypothetical protein
MREFPEFATAPHASLVALDEEWMKSKEGKERWRGFINALRALSCLFGGSSLNALFLGMRGRSRTIISDR